MTQGKREKLRAIQVLEPRHHRIRQDVTAGPDAQGAPPEVAPMRSDTNLMRLPVPDEPRVDPAGIEGQQGGPLP